MNNKLSMKDLSSRDMHKWTEEEILNLIALKQSGLSWKQVAAQYNRNTNTIYQIVKRYLNTSDGGVAAIHAEEEAEAERLDAAFNNRRKEG